MSLNLHDKPKVIVGMSGGVDSSVSAFLLKEQGYQVEGLFMKNWEEDDTDSFCSAEADIKDARSVCEKLQIKFHTVNFAAEYWHSVFSFFLKEYEAGRTPNPDILCNKEIKFNLCLKYAQSLGADLFATGHYAQNIHQSLIKSADQNKDQTYFIYTLTPDLLEKILFPIGHLEKPDIRQIAADSGLTTHNKKDSTGICFIGEKKFKQFLSKYLTAPPGNIETLEGKIIGVHDGLMHYTRGQRQGIGIGGQRHSSGEPFYVIKKDLARNVLIIAQGHEHPALFSSRLVFEEAHWIYPQVFPLKCRAKIRYRQTEQDCSVHTEDNIHYTVIFEQPQWAAAPGQSVVFYQEDRCLGGGIITAYH